MSAELYIVPLRLDDVAKIGLEGVSCCTYERSVFAPFC